MMGSSQTKAVPKIFRDHSHCLCCRHMRQGQGRQKTQTYWPGSNMGIGCSHKPGISVNTHPWSWAVMLNNSVYVKALVLILAQGTKYGSILSERINACNTHSWDWYGCRNIQIITANHGKFSICLFSYLDLSILSLSACFFYQDPPTVTQETINTP